MARKELKATEKTVLKHSRDGVIEQNLADGSAKKVSKKAEEAVLKTARPDDERFDKLKAAGLVVEDVKKPDHRKLEFVNTYYHKDIYLKFSFVFPNIL